MGIAGDFVLIVVAGLGGALLARVLGLPLLVGYVAAGVVVGPHTAGPTVANIEDIELLAEIGVALLLFALGLEVSFRDLRAVRPVALIGGPIQIGLTAWFGAWVARTALDMPTIDAVWFGAMVSLSSTMVVLKTLTADGTLSTLACRVMVGLLVVQDLAVVPMLIVLPRLSSTGDVVPRLAQAGLVAAAFLLAMVLIGTRVLPALLRRIAAWGSRELFLVASVAAGVGIGWLSYQLGLSFAIGAFVAGIVLSESELSHQARSDVAPLRDIFGLIFFVSVGMLFDPRYVVAHAGQVALIVAVIVTGKSVICGLLARAFGYGRTAPWIVGLGLSQIGEFSFVLARAGHTGRFIAEETYDLALICTVLSMTLAPLVSSGALPLARAWSRWRKPRQPSRVMQLPRSLENHVVVAGYGRTGRAVVDALRGVTLPPCRPGGGARVSVSCVLAADVGATNTRLRVSAVPSDSAPRTVAETVSASGDAAWLKREIVAFSEQAVGQVGGRLMTAAIGLPGKVSADRQSCAISYLDPDRCVGFTDLFQRLGVVRGLVLNDLECGALGVA